MVRAWGRTAEDAGPDDSGPKQDSGADTKDREGRAQ